MGQGLPKAVTSVVVERHAGPLFRAGMAEMNGWRTGMEDTHVVVAREDWGFFGVFDGHGGTQCSAFIAQRFEEELSQGPLPADDAAVTSLTLRLDSEYLAREQPSGSTGTFVFVKAPKDGGKHVLRVGNVGDSRVLLGRLDGSLVECPGTDGALTTDHKPDHPSEKERIERTGGTVQEVMGVARVNGDLAVSRAFGDAQYKQTGGPAQEDRPVSAAPELMTMECEATDFLMLVCDGISEGEFPNREVVARAARELREGGKAPDPGAAAISVCREALRCGSKDNLSCMIVMFGPGDLPNTGKMLLPGPFSFPENRSFREAYAAMAKRVDMSLPQAVEKRYDLAKQEMANTEGKDDFERSELQSEVSVFGKGPLENLEVGSSERTEWFSNWLDDYIGSKTVGPGSSSSTAMQDQLMEILQDNPEFWAAAQAQGLLAERGNAQKRQVQVVDSEKLRDLVAENNAVQWDDRLLEFGGLRGFVTQDDNADGTSKVRLSRDGVSQVENVWLPTCALIEVKEEEEASSGSQPDGGGDEERTKSD